MKLFFALFMLFGIFAFAEGNLALPPVDLRPGEFVDGALFSVRVVPGARETSFYVVGKQTAKVKLDKLKLQLIVDPEGARKTFTLQRKNEAYIFSQKILKDAQLEIQGEEGQVDKLRLKVAP